MKSRRLNEQEIEIIRELSQSYFTVMSIYEDLESILDRFSYFNKEVFQLDNFIIHILQDIDDNSIPEVFKPKLPEDHFKIASLKIKLAPFYKKVQIEQYEKDHPEIINRFDPSKEATSISINLKLKREKRELERKSYTPSLAQRIAHKKAGLTATLTNQAEVIKTYARIKNGDVLLDEIARDYLLGFKKQIENTHWKTNFGGGIIIPGVNQNKPLPDTIAIIYKHIVESLEQGDYWPAILKNIEPHMDTANKKSKAWNLFGKRDQNTIKFYEDFGKTFSDLKSKLHDLHDKLKEKDDEKEAPHHSAHK